MLQPEETGAAWQECLVEETDARGRKKYTTEARDSRRGIPQAPPLSPLLANAYMRRFVLAWKRLGLQRSLGSRIVTYVDESGDPVREREG